MIELDGALRYEENAKGYDAARIEFLNAAGIGMLRFPNAAIDNDFAGVCMVEDRYAEHQVMQNGRSE